MAISKRTGIIGGLAALVAASVVTLTLLSPSGIVNTRTETDYGSDLQAAINAAEPGDTLTLPADATLSCNCVIGKSITIESGGSRPVQAYGSTFNVGAKVITPNTLPALTVLPGVKNVRFRGIEIAPQGEVVNLVKIGTDGPAQDTLEEAPSGITLENVWIHGLPGVNARRGIAANGANISVLNSRINEIHDANSDSQAICGWNGPGPFHIISNYLEAAAENVMFGGADAMIEALTPADVEMRHNYVAKPLSWEGVWAVKNLFETKNVRRLFIDGNIFDGNWKSAQVGYAILIKSNNQDGTNNWAATLDLTFTNNTIKNSTHGLNIMGIENPGKLSGVSARLKFINNLWLINGIFLQGFQGAEDVVVDHNTVISTGVGSTMSLYSIPAKNFTATNNIMPHTGYGIKGDSVGEGTDSLAKFAPGYTFRKNLMAGPRVSPDGPMNWPAVYPPDNFYPESFNGVFVDPANGNYRLVVGSPYKGAGTDGKDLGVDFDVLEAAQTKPSTSPSPSVTPTVAVSPTPLASPSVSPSPTATPTVLPTSTPTPVTTPTVRPSPTPRIFCERGERPGNPPICTCRHGFLGNSGKCA